MAFITNLTLKNKMVPSAVTLSLFNVNYYCASHVDEIS